MAIFGTLGEIDLSAVSASITDTAVDVFVYDTTKDSDGGAWRKRTQHTSWYNETLGTATRGTRREFPAVAVLVLETGYLKIYDGDDPDLPMWMVLNATSNSLVRAPFASSVAMLNAKLVVADGNNYSGSTIDFLLDDKDADRDLRQVGWNGNIADRNDTSKQGGFGSSLLVNGSAYDVAMTVLPNAPIDPSTGLPVPTIAVATDGGVSVIKDDGTVVDITASAAGSYSSAKFVSMSSDGFLVFPQHGSSATSGEYSLMTIPIPSSDTTTQTNSGNATDKYIFNDPNTALTSLPHGLGTSQNGALRIPGTQFLNYPNGLAILDENPTSLSNAMVAYIKSDYNTGWMHGDIKGAFLSDTDTTNAGIELVTNGDFADTNLSNYFTLFNSDVNGGTEANSAPYVNGSNQVVMGNSARLKATYNFVAGRVYKFSYDCVSQSIAAQRLGIYVPSGVTLQLDDQITAGGTNTFYYTATSTGSILVEWMSRGGGWGAYDNFSIIQAEEDRSVNNNPLTVYGTVTKSAVATGAELVAYGPFTTNNHLQQPYNSDLNFGTGDFSVMCWIKTSSTSVDIVMSKASPGSIGAPYFELQMNGGDIYFVGSNTSNNKTYFGNIADGTWKHICYVRSGGIALGYTNGELYETKVEPGNFNHSSNDTLLLGYRQDGYSGTFDGSLALFRISGSIPSPEQIKKIYEDEKCLFQENAKATLYGSSDAVTALAYDDATNLLHVGTSDGRSDFQGLRRINNTTDPVTTAISAHDSLIIEQ